MEGSVLVSHLHEPSDVYAGLSGHRAGFWQGFITPGWLASEAESFEYNRIPAGAVIDQHVHTRTEEIYYILTGTGLMTTPGGTTPIGPGDLVLTPLGGIHGLDNTGVTDLEFLVVEVLPGTVTSGMPAKGSYV